MTFPVPSKPMEINFSCDESVELHLRFWCVYGVTNWEIWKVYIIIQEGHITKITMGLDIGV